MHKLCNDRQTNLHEWVENIANEFYEEKYIEERTLLDDVSTMIYNDLHSSFILCDFVFPLQIFN